MLRFITGQARTGKTAFIMKEISEAVKNRKEGFFLIVPEQFSHEAERALCDACGDTMSLYAHAASFSYLARLVMEECGGQAVPYIDDGGRLLCTALAMEDADIRNVNAMLDAINELKNAGIRPEDLKGREDIAEIYRRYEQTVAQSGADPADRLSVLNEQLKDCNIGNDFYFDGFTDFSAVELDVIKTLLDKGCNVTISLNLKDSLSDYTAKKLSSYRGEIIALTEKNLESRISCFSAETPVAECEFAASKILEFARSGQRWRETAVAIRNYDEYRSVMKSVFDQYGVPYFESRREELSEKPLPILIANAYEVINNGWNYDDVITYLETNLLSVSREDADILSSYIFKWHIRESQWMSPKDWGQHPDGYQKEYNDAAYSRLQRINEIRRKVADPLIRLQKAEGRPVYALAEYLKCVRCDDEQEWNAVVEALEQFDAIMGAREMSREDFARLFMLMLSKYDIGRIPMAIDRVIVGDFDRMRKRNIRNLIVLGASDDRLPAQGKENAVFSKDERREIFPDSGIEIYRESSIIYNTFSLPSNKLILCYPLQNAGGDKTRPCSFMDGRTITPVELDKVRLASYDSALVLSSGKSSGAAAARKWFEENDSGKLEAINMAAETGKRKLGEDTVVALYGKDPRISTSRADKFFSCRFAYFCKYGLRLEPYSAAQFSASEIGTFTHYVLEKVAKELPLSDPELEASVDRYTEQYVHEELNDFAEKTERFIWLFRRNADNVKGIALDMAHELENSDFKPEHFEMRLPGIGIADRVDVMEKDGRKLVRVVDYKTGSKEFSLTDIWYGMSMQMVMYLYALTNDGENEYEGAGVMYIPARNPMVSTGPEPTEDEIEKKRSKELKKTGVALEGTEKQDGQISVSKEELELLCRHVNRKIEEMKEEVANGSIDCDPFEMSGSKACTYCDFKSCCGLVLDTRKLERIKPDEIWDMMRAEEEETE